MAGSCGFTQRVSTALFVVWASGGSCLRLAHATQPERCCATAGYTHGDLAGYKPYKVNTYESAYFSVTPVAARAVVQLAAATWNEQGNAGYFRYMGSSTRVSLPDSLADCQALGIDYSLVRYVHNETQRTYGDADSPGDVYCDSVSAVAIPRCKDAAEAGTRFEILINSHKEVDHDDTSTETCEPVNYDNGMVQPLTTDYVSVLVHEFGHTLGLGHPDGHGGSTVLGAPAGCAPAAAADEGMSTMLGSNNAATRDLHEWDYRCAPLVAGTRSVAFERALTGSGGVGLEGYWTSGAKGTVGLTYDGGTPKFAGVAHDGTSFKWDEDVDGTGLASISGPSAYNGAPITTSVFREDPSIDRVIYSYWDDEDALDVVPDNDDDYKPDAGHVLLQVLSSNEFVSGTSPPDFLRACSVAGATCLTANRKKIYTSHRPSIAYWNEGGANRTVFTWVHRDPHGGGHLSTSNQLRISVGTIDSWTLAAPTVTTLRSSTAPGVACFEDFASPAEWDCLLAYVPATNLENPVRVRRFRIEGAAMPYSVVFDTTDFATGMQSGHALAMWYQTSTDRFYLAAKDQTGLYGYDLVRVRTSPLGDSWTFHTSSSYSNSGPSAASAWRGDNNILGLDP